MRRAKLRPTQSITYISRSGISILDAEEVTPNTVGCKAYGLATLPSGWTQPFFVVSSECDFEFAETIGESASVFAFLVQALTSIGAGPDATVIVRSSGSRETLSRRGALESETCRRDQVAATIRSLAKKLSDRLMVDSGGVHWVVQLKIEPRERGHLSNERRLKREPRDWVVEFEHRAAEAGMGSSESLAVRRWRDGDLVHTDTLGCAHRVELLARLKQVAQWGMQFAPRLHFEWVWDGDRLFVVQVDWEEAALGDVPTNSAVQPIQGIPSRLNVFRRATAGDFDKYKKLANAKMYRDLAYEMPDFYILDDQKTIQEILKGQISSPLLSDLGVLTGAALIVRVDGANVPVNKREMLPRSDELRSAAGASAWLTGDFSTKVAANELGDCGVCLIAHHFVPAMASAWARAEPHSRIVRIESLWGVPEGLYWYSHDTFEVDTRVVESADLTEDVARQFKIRRRLRYKGFFVAPNEQGEWVSHVTRSSHDWKSSVSKASWIREIALTTRKIADEMGEPTAVMWFVDVNSAACKHRVLPWFHTRSEYATKIRAAPRRKISSNKDFVIATREDWDRLVAMPAGNPIDRVRVEPRDAELIRNTEFADGIAKEAKERGFVVELAGGVLSHIYYLLTRQECRVECIDLYGVADEVLAFHKIVRDRIPEQIEKAGESVSAVRLEGEALRVALRRKLVEEAYEVLDASSRDDLRAELADVLEVVDALIKSADLTVEEVANEKERKSQKRGGFDKGFMLVETTLSHALGGQSPSPEKGSRTFDIVPTVDDLRSVGSARFEVRPDLRTVSGGVEKLIAFNVEVGALGVQSGVTTFGLPLGHQDVELQLVIELSRHGGEVRGAIRLREVPVQMVLDLSIK